MLEAKGDGSVYRARTCTKTYARELQSLLLVFSLSLSLSFTFLSLSRCLSHTSFTRCLSIDSLLSFSHSISFLLVESKAHMSQAARTANVATIGAITATPQRGVGCMDAPTYIWHLVTNRSERDNGCNRWERKSHGMNLRYLRHVRTTQAVYTWSRVQLMAASYYHIFVECKTANGIQLGGSRVV